jgi:hypothetical protein
MSFLWFIEMWASANHSTNSTICGLFLDVSAVVLFVFANLLVPVSVTAHYAVFPLFPFYLPPILPSSLATSPFVRIGFGTACLYGVCVFANTGIVTAVLRSLFTGELRFQLFLILRITKTKLGISIN